VFRGVRRCSRSSARWRRRRGHYIPGGKREPGETERTVDMQSWNYRAMHVVSLHNRSEKNSLTWIDRAQRSAALGIICPGQFVDAQVDLADLPDVLTGKADPDTIKIALRLDPADA
jgi:hypothetical protein